jgi:hypothetical protein
MFGTHAVVSLHICADEILIGERKHFDHVLFDGRASVLEWLAARSKRALQIMSAISEFPG